MSINGIRFSTLQRQSFSNLIDSHQHHTKFFRDRYSVNTKQLYPVISRHISMPSSLPWTIPMD